MISIQAKAAIVDELDGIFNQSEANQLLEILENILSAPLPIKELAGITERFPPALNTVFDPRASLSEIINCSSNFFKVEPVLKLLLFWVDEKAYSRIYTQNLGFIAIIKELGLNPENKSLTVDSNKYKGSHGYIEQIARTYQVRNAEAHSCEAWGRKELFYNINCTITTILYAIKLHKKTLISKLSKQRDSEIDVSAYMDELIGYFREKMNRFISLNGEENLALVDRYIVENLDENEDKRFGTIDELRQTKVPERKMIIWGEAGTGKSTTLEYLASKDANDWKKNNSSPIPVLIPLGLLVSSTKSIVDYMSKKLHLPIESIETLLTQGRFNLFFDGLNEIPKDGENALKTKRIREIASLMDSYSNNFYIISNRPNDVSDFKNTPVFNLVKLSDEQTQTFLNKNTRRKDTITKIDAAIKSNSRLQNIVRTPLMLSRLIEIVEKTGEIPNSEGRIIGAFLQTLFDREYTEKQDRNFDKKKATYLLRSIAYNGLEESSTNSGMSEEVVISYMQKCMRSYSFSVDTFYYLDILGQLGILIKREDVYLFAHQAYQDYYHAMEEMAVLGVV